MTWTVVVVLAAGVWGQRFLGMYVGGPVLSRFPALGKLATLIPAAVVTAVIVQLTVASGASLVLDARFAGVAVSGILVWRRAPFVIVVVTAAAATALVRSLSRRNPDKYAGGATASHSKTSVLPGCPIPRTADSPLAAPQRRF